ncbi:MAG TPA: alpha/beta hydrolase domain-containing protein, partial [Stellaceae bacterium]
MKCSIALCAILVALGSPAEARITAVVIDRIEPFAEGMPFGDVGAYERVIGTAKGELDPADRRNRGIVNLDKAARNARGMVEYDTDFFVLRPADESRGSRKLLYEVNNRGRKFLTHWLMDAPPANANDPRTAEDAGDGLLFRMGFTMVWSGWDPDAPRGNNGMAMHVPVAQADGRPIVRTIRDELVSGTRAPEAATFKLSYAAASLDTAKARLTVRAKEAEPERAVPADQWAFVDERTIKLLPDGTKPAPGALFELTYDAKAPKVLGIGFAATRDLVSYLRYAERDGRAPHPVGGIKAALAFGISQSGRYLRDFIAQGFNQDEAQNRVFDGVLTHISGVGRVFLNAEFGQPFRTNTQHEDHLMPEN